MRQQDVHRAAVTLFAERGYAATGIRDIGAMAGMNSATLYHYASTKEDLLAAVMRECLTELLRSARSAVADTHDPVGQLAGVVAVHVAMEAMNPLTSRVTDQEFRSLTGGRRAEVLGLRDAYEGIVAGILEAGREGGAFPVSDSRVTRLALLQMCNGVGNWFTPARRLSLTQLQDQFVELACRLVAADPPGSEAFDQQRVAVAVLGCEPLRQKRRGADLTRRKASA